MRDSLFDALDGMEMGKSEHDWMEQRFGSMTAKERLLFQGAIQLEHPQTVEETLRVLSGLDQYRLLYGADDDVAHDWRLCHPGQVSQPEQPGRCLGGLP